MKISGPGVSQNILDIEGNAIKKKKKENVFGHPLPLPTLQ